MFEEILIIEFWINMLKSLGIKNKNVFEMIMIRD